MKSGETIFMGSYLARVLKDELRPYPHNRGGKVILRSTVNAIKRDFNVDALQLSKVVIYNGLPVRLADGVIIRSGTYFTHTNRTQALIELLRSDDSKLTREILDTYKVELSYTDDFLEALQANKDHGLQRVHSTSELLHDPNYYAGGLLTGVKNEVQKLLGPSYSNYERLVNKWSGQLGFILYAIGHANAYRKKTAFSDIQAAANMVRSRKLTKALQKESSGSYACVSPYDVSALGAAVAHYLRVVSLAMPLARDIADVKSVLQSADFFSFMVLEIYNGTKLYRSKKNPEWLKEKILNSLSGIKASLPGLDRGTEGERKQKVTDLREMIANSKKASKRDVEEVPDFEYVADL